MAANIQETILSELKTLYDADIARKKPFQARAYATAIQSLQSLQKPITSIKDVEGLKGVGEKIKSKIQEILETGKLASAEEARRSLPLESLVSLQTVHGIGPTKANDLIKKGITTIEQLRVASEADQKLLTATQKLGLRYRADSQLRIPRSEMQKHEAILLASFDDAFEATVVGSYRRGAESSGDIDVLLTLPDTVSAKDQASLFLDMIGLMKDSMYIVDTLSSGPTKFLGYCRLDTNHPVRRLDLLMIPKSEYACAILYFTGSQQFNVGFRSYALEKGYTLNEHRLQATREGVPPVPPFANEKDIFDFLGLKYVEPSLRVDGRDVVSV